MPTEDDPSQAQQSQFGPPGSGGRPTVWDSSMGQGGEWVTLPDSKFADYGLNRDDYPGLPPAPAIGPVDIAGGGPPSVATSTGPPEDFDWSPFSTYAPSTYYEAPTYTPPEGAVPYQNFDASKYLQANPDVWDDEGFRANPEAVYSHYVGRYPDSFETNLPGYTGPRPGDYSRYDNWLDDPPDIEIPSVPGWPPDEPGSLPIVELTDADRMSAAIAALDQFRITEVDPNDSDKTITTNALLLELTGGWIPDNVDIDELIKSGSLEDIEKLVKSLTDRNRARHEEGYLGEWDTGGYEAFAETAGVTAGDVDPYGAQTTQGYIRQQISDPQLPAGTELQPILYETKPEEMLQQDYNINPLGTQSQATLAPQATQAQAAPTLPASSFQETIAAPQVDQKAIAAATQVDTRDRVQAQQGEIDPLSTVQGQLAKLYSQFDGNTPPPFAAGAIRVAEQRLASRGMGASGMAGAAITQAAMEAATPIAAADAQTYARMQELNLNNRQQAEVLNSQQTLQLDLANLTRDQQTRVFNAQNHIQSIFTDQAATNAASQFNAQSDQQNNQYFSTMFNETSKYNAAQTNAINQFNAGETNAIEKFNSEMQNQREQFNTKNRLFIDQSNVVWRRQVNTANTALQNASNEFNVKNKFNLSNQALNNIWQQYRDTEFWARTTSRDQAEFNRKIAYATFVQKAGTDAAFADNVMGIALEVGGTILKNTPWKDIFP